MGKNRYMRKNSSSIYRQSRKVHSIESLEVYVKDMETRHTQIGRGGLSASIFGAKVGNSFFNNCYFNNDVISEGAVPKGVLTVGFLLESKKPNIVSGQTIHMGDVLLLEEGESIIHRITAESHFLVLQVNHLDLYMLGVRPEESRSRIYKKNENMCNRQYIGKISDILHNIRNCEEEVLCHMEEGVVYKHILAETAYMLSQADKPVLINRHEYIKTARVIREYLWQHSIDVIQVADLCYITGKSERTLERICKYAFGKPPRELIKIHRLNAVRKVIKNIPAEEEINFTLLPMQYGFTNAGRFAGEYRKLFGELPSQTKRD